MAIGSVTIVGTGLIGTSVAMALRRAGFSGRLVGVDRSEGERAAAMLTRAFDAVVPEPDVIWAEADVVVLAMPVLAILDWIERRFEALHGSKLVTDVGSTKAAIAAKARALRAGGADAEFLPGHPMAGKESGGAAVGDAALFEGATWLFTPIADETERTADWRTWVERMGARPRDMDAEEHDVLCAWVSHLPQFLSTALAGVLEERFGTAGESGMAALEGVGGRALRETTRLGASPYSMWRDVAMTNEGPIAETLLALEQELAHLRENLRTPELREAFLRANRFRQR